MATKSLKIWTGKYSVIVIASLLLSSCSERYIKSKPICDKRLYIGFYTEWSDMGAIYLTDSINFNVKIDRFNVESEYYKFECKLDSLIIEKWSKDELTSEHILQTKRLSIKALIEESK